MKAPEGCSQFRDFMQTCVLFPTFARPVSWSLKAGNWSRNHAPDSMENMLSAMMNRMLNMDCLQRQRKSKWSKGKENYLSGVEKKI